MSRKATRSKPSISRLREIFIYDPEDGTLRWRTQQARRCRIGMEAGNLRPDGKRRVKVDGVLIYTHQIAWAICHGEWCDVTVDHEDRNGTNNAIGNLRRATDTQQSQNRIFKNNAVGHRGLRYQSSGNIGVQIQVDGKKVSLGTYMTREEAIAVRIAAEKKYFGEFAPC